LTLVCDPCAGDLGAPQALVRRYTVAQFVASEGTGTALVGFANSAQPDGMLMA
jgi:hypothetical protein